MYGCETGYSKDRDEEEKKTKIEKSYLNTPFLAISWEAAVVTSGCSCWCLIAVGTGQISGPNGVGAGHGMVGEFRLNWYFSRVVSILIVTKSTKFSI